MAAIGNLASPWAELNPALLALVFRFVTDDAERFVAKHSRLLTYLCC